MFSEQTRSLFFEVKISMTFEVSAQFGQRFTMNKVVLYSLWFLAICSLRLYFYYKQLLACIEASSASKMGISAIFEVAKLLIEMKI